MKRRHFLLTAPGAAAGIYAPWSLSAVPCPPPVVNAGSATALSASCPTSTNPGSSSLGTLAASMSTGQWNDFVMGGMNGSLLDAGGGRSITEYSARGHWDPVRRKVQYWGQGHYTAEKLITWDEASNQWSVGPTANVSSIGHAYYHLALDPASGDLYLHGYNSTATKRKPYNGSWSAIAPGPNNASLVAGGLEWFPALNGGAGGLVYVDQASVQTWNPSTNAWTVRGSLSGLGPYNIWIAAAAGAVYFGGGDGSSATYRMSASGAVSSAPSTPIGGGVGAGIVLQHPDGNQLLQFAPGATGAIYRFNGSSWVAHGTHQIGGLTLHRFGVPIRDHGVVLFISYSGGSPIVKLYRP
jgi:hypothetical protein